MSSAQFYKWRAQFSGIDASLQSTYASSKHAVKGFTGSLRVEVVEKEVPFLTLVNPASVASTFVDPAKNYMVFFRHYLLRSMRLSFWPKRIRTQPNILVASYTLQVQPSC